MYYEADKNQQNANCVYICLRFILPFFYFSFFLSTEMKNQSSDIRMNGLSLFIYQLNECALRLWIVKMQVS